MKMRIKPLLCTITLLILSLADKLSAQATNFDFELTPTGTYSTANAVAGWTVANRTADSQCTPTLWLSGSPEFSVLSTPIQNFPGAGIICHSPLGGTTVVQLNNSSIGNYSSTKISRTIAVTAANSLFTFAFAGYWQGLGHACCDAAYFKVLVRDCSGALLSCPSLNLHPGTVCGNSTTNYSIHAVSNSWTNWQTRAIDLTPYIGTCVTIEAITTDCAFGGHYGTTLFDAQCGSHFNPHWNTSTNVSPGNAVSFCSGSNQAVLQAPQGYATYSWIPPSSHPTLSASQATQSTLSTSNAIPGSTFTVNITNANGCTFTHTVAVGYTSVGIAGLGSSPSCSLGSSGSATVLGTGSGSGYSYVWLSGSNSVVATASIVNNLAPGIYSVTVTATGSQSNSCGAAVSTVTIGTTSPGLKSVIKPFCGNEVHFAYPGGVNYQWYNNLTAISATAGGTSSNYSASSPTLNGSIYHLRYTSPQGCADSLKFTLVSTSSSGSVTVSHNPLVCPGSSNGSVVLTILPSTCLSCGVNSFSVFSTGSLTPPYSATLNPTSLTTFTATNLSAGGTYSVKAFDGSCNYTTSFSVTSHVFDYTLSPSNSPTICSGTSIAAGVSFTSPASFSQYTYSWSPGTFLFGNVTQQNPIIVNPTAAPGSVSTIVYTVVVTPSIVNCPLTKTLALVIANPLTPTITALPALCNNVANYTVSALPAGGVFFDYNGAISSSGVLSPTLAALGLNTFTYANAIGTCVAKSSASYSVNSPPIISIAGNTMICEGQSTTLLASGANSYSWSNSASSPFTTLSPVISTTYTVTGNDAVTNCSAENTITVVVMPLPSLSISGDTLLCAGESTSLTATGASSYSWSNGSTSQVITISPLTSTTYTLFGVSQPGSCSSLKTILIDVGTCTSIYELNNSKNSLQVYPNPNNGLFFINTEDTIEISLYNETGKLIQHKEYQRGGHSIDLSEYPAGIYLLKSLNTTETKIIKLVKTD